MSYHEYKVSTYISLKDYPFYAIIMAAMRQADTDNTEKLQEAWPDVWKELEARYQMPGGFLPGEERPKPTCGSPMPQEDRDALGIKTWDPHCARADGHEGEHAISQEGIAWGGDDDGED